MESSLVRLALNALQGVESSLISIEKLSSLLCSEPADRTTHHIPSLWHWLSSTHALGQILRDIGCFGSLAFAIAVRKVLEGYISGLDTLCASVQLRRSSNMVDGSDRGPSSLGCLTNVPGATSLPISFGDGERLEKSSGNYTLDESLLVPSTVAMDLARDQSGSESDDQKTEDRWFSEIDTSCSSECSSTRDFSESSDVGDSLSEVSMRQCDCMSLGDDGEAEV
ncbi:hypothetical protein YC2023_072469 [Brassica napus]